eukprot:g3956.t1 g3956   contig15:10972-12775(-)
MVVSRGVEVLPVVDALDKERRNSEAKIFDTTLCEAPQQQAGIISSKNPSSSLDNNVSVTYKPSDPAEPVADPAVVIGSDGKAVNVSVDASDGKGGMWGEAEDDGLYHGLFPRRQLWRPRLEYPLWDSNWDGRQPPSIVANLDDDDAANASTSSNVANAKDGNATTTTTTHKQLTQAQRDRHIRKNGITKHIILIRHGQYDETHPEDHKRLLTPLGRHQAALTGQRLGALIRGVNEEFGPCNVKVVRVSDLARAKETADIVYENMGLEGVVVEKAESDPLLNEGRPCHHIPGGKVRQSVIERTDEHHPRIEQAFRSTSIVPILHQCHRWTEIRVVAGRHQRL